MGLELTKDHFYQWDGVTFPGVTNTLLSAGLIDTSRFDEYYRERGSMAHRAIALSLEGDLDRESLDPAIAGFVTAAERAVEALGIIPLEIEKCLFSKIFKYGGTLDLYGIRRNTDTMIVVDWKTGNVEPWVALQLAAYSQLAFEDSPNLKFEERISVRLNSDGKFKVHSFTNPTDRDVFLAALAVTNWKNNNNR